MSGFWSSWPDHDSSSCALALVSRRPSCPPGAAGWGKKSLLWQQITVAISLVQFCSCARGPHAGAQGHY